jgi:hypothetical protein
LSDHVGKGLEIESSGGTVSLYEVTASNNQLFGANIEAQGTVFVNDSVFNGNMSYKSVSCGDKEYYGYGLQVATNSDVYLSGVTANKNYLFGAHLEGAYVEVGNSTFNLNSTGSNRTPTGRGLEIEATGDVLVQHIQANNNQLFGANIQANGDVTVLSSVFAGNKYTNQGNRGGYGLKVVAKGDVLLGAASDTPSTGVSATGNGAEGAILTSNATVQVSNSTFNNNGTNGLTITANGNVTLTNVNATGNASNGVEITGTCSSVISVNGGIFANNSRYGIKVNKGKYTPSGSPTFANNSSGNVSQSSSGCASTGGGSSSTNNNTSNGSSPWQWWFGYSAR